MTATALANGAEVSVTAALRRPRLGFLGLGWIGRNRMEAIAADGCSEIVALADASEDAIANAHALAPGASAFGSFEALLACELDGLVVATPSALHAQQVQAALERGVAVFCQKPLARTAPETAQVIAAARAADCLLRVDLSYRETVAVRKIRELVAGGELGEIYAVDLVFHNAYGPDKAWFRDPLLSGGGCVIDLGIHLVDLALWMLDFPAVSNVSSRLFAQGRALGPRPQVVEDYAVAQFDLANGAVARLTCSWYLPAGCDAVIEATFTGSRGAASFRNVNGSFYDFVAERFEGTRRATLAQPPDAWGGRAAAAWARRLAVDPGFEPDIERIAHVAAVLDAIYGR
ncbi:MAG TPA: Gfo/Idh/MocA family oxidoreductase [Burkholderiales bacterium]|nr:Gfo/Idh/MocA family oxidoreductase [Burkholderiales bacterium]